MKRSRLLMRINYGEPKGTEVDADYQEEAWSVYKENQDVFASVLRATGPWQLQDGMDLVHDFVVDQLPQALITYSPNRGPIKPWLFTVFRHYARRRILEISSLRKRWTSEDFAEPFLLSQHDESYLSAEEKIGLRNAVQQLPEEQRLSLSVYFGNSHDAGSLNALARKFQWSKHKSKQTLLRAIAAVAALIGEKGILTSLELDICQAKLVREEEWPSIAARLGKTEYQARSLLKNALEKLSVSLGKQ